MLRVSLKELLAHKFRLVLTSIAVILGVAFMSGTLVLTDTLRSVFNNLFGQTTKGVSAVVRAKEPFKAERHSHGAGINGNRPPVPASLLAQLESVPGVKSARGGVQGYALVVGKNGKAIANNGPPTLGIAWSTTSELEQALHLLRGRRPTRPNQLALDESTAKKAKVKVGGTVKVVFLSVPPREFTVSGIFRFGDAGNLAGATLAAFDTPTAQEVMGRVGRYDVIEFAAKPGVSETVLRDRLARQLQTAPGGSGDEAITGKQLAHETASSIEQGLSFFNIFLLIFAAVALFVGSFIIYNTFSIIVTQRARELALLRALGASGRQVMGSVALEALGVGLFSSVVGLGLGILVALGLQALLNGFGIDLPSGGMVIAPRTIVVAVVAGTVVTLVAAISPARRAARVPPVAAMRDQVISLSSGRRRYYIGGLVTLAGIVLFAVGLVGHVKSSAVPGGAAGVVGAAALLVFVGVAMLSPLVARPVADLLGWAPARLRGMTGQLARENATRNPRRTASTAAALMIGIGIVSFVAITASSLKSSFNRIIDKSVRADFLLTGKGFNNFSPQAVAALRRKLPGATVVEFRTGAFQLNGQTKLLLGVPADLEQVLDVKLRPGADLAAFADGGVLVFKNTAKDNGWRVGHTIPMRFAATGVSNVPIRGIFGENSAVNGTSYLLSLKQYEAGFSDQLDAFAGIRKSPGVSAAATRKAVERVLEGFPNVDVKDQTEFKAAQAAQFDQLLGLVYVMLMLSVIIALIGIVNTLALSIFERTRELGLLRAVGMTRVQMRRMVRYEAAIVSVFGSLLGLALGLVSGRAIIGAFSDQSIGFSLPVFQLVLFVIAAGFAGLGAGFFPARRAAKLDVLRAIAAV